MKTNITKSFRLTIVAIILMVCHSAMLGQEWNWSKNLSSEEKVRVNDIAYSSYDTSICIIVSFEDTLYFPGSPGYKARGASVDSDILVAKFDSDSNFVWGAHIGSDGVESPKDLYINDNGEIFVTGSFSSDVYVDNVYQESGEVGGSEEVMLAKFNPNGSLAWLKRIGTGVGNDRGDALTIDGSGNIYVTGFTDGAIDLGGPQLPNNGFINTFIVKLDANGDYLDQFYFPGTNDVLRLEAIEMANDGGKMVTGVFGDKFYLINGDSLTSQGAEDIMVFKLSANDTIEWVRQVGGAGKDVGYNAISDEYGANYIVGEVYGTVDLDSTGKGLFDGSSFTTNGESDIFVAKYNKNGNLLWKRVLGGSGKDIGRGIEYDDGIIHFSGHITGTVVVGGDTLTSAGSKEDACFGRINANGAFIAMATVEGTGVDRGLGIAYNELVGENIGGFFRSNPLTVGDDVLPNNSRNNGLHQGFIAQYLPEFAAAVIDQQSPKCPGDANGQIQVEAYFGDRPFTFEWSHDGGLNSAIASGLSAGSYEVIVTSNDLKKDTVQVTLSDPTPIDITLTPQNLSCYQSADGSIGTVVTGGSGELSYNWVGGDGLVPDDKDQNGLGTGWFKVTVTDNNLCQEKDSVELSQPAELQITAESIVQESSVGANDGSIDIAVSGGTPTYNYAWKDAADVLMLGRVNDTLTNVTEGNYKAIVTDDNSCKDSATFVVPGENLAVSLIGTNSTCFSVADGSAYAEIAAGYHVGRVYNYTFKNASDVTLIPNGDTIQDLAPGWYYVTLDETGGPLPRSASDSVEITQPDDIILSLTPTHVECNGDATGSIVLMPTGGTPDYTYLWSNGAQTQSISTIVAGKYVVTVTDENGCEKADSATITEPVALIVTVDSLQGISCNGNLQATARANVSGGYGTKSYSWNDPGGQSQAVATALGAGDYTVTVNDEYGCTAQGNISFTEPDVLAIASVDTNHITCLNSNDGTIKVNVVGGTPNYSYTWDPIPAFGQGTDSVAGLFPQSYGVVIKDANDCQLEEVSFTMRQPTVPLSVEMQDNSQVNNFCYGYDSASFGVIGSGGWGLYEYSIDTGKTYQSSTIFEFLPAGSYGVLIKDAGNCVRAIQNPIVITEPEELIIDYANVNGMDITVLADGGTQPYTFYLEGGQPQATGEYTVALDGNYTVSVADVNKCIPVADTTLAVGTDAINESKIGTVSIYPNPTNGLFTIELPDYNAQLIELYNAQGRKVKVVAVENYARNIKLDMSNEAAGVYLIKVDGVILRNRLLIE